MNTAPSLVHMAAGSLSAEAQVEAALNSVYSTLHNRFLCIAATAELIRRPRDA